MVSLAMRSSQRSCTSGIEYCVDSSTRKSYLPPFVLSYTLSSDQYLRQQQPRSARECRVSTPHHAQTQVMTCTRRGMTRNRAHRRRHRPGNALDGGWHVTGRAPAKAQAKSCTRRGWHVTGRMHRLCIINFHPVLSANCCSPSGKVSLVASHSLTPPASPLAYLHHQ